MNMTLANVNMSQEETTNFYDKMAGVTHATYSRFATQTGSRLISKRYNDSFQSLFHGKSLNLKTEAQI